MDGNRLPSMSVLGTTVQAQIAICRFFEIVRFRCLVSNQSGLFPCIRIIESFTPKDPEETPKQ